MSTSKPQIPPLTLYSPSNARPPLSSRDYSHPTLFTSSSPDSLRFKSKDTYSPNTIQALRVPSSQLPFRPSPPQPSQPTSLLLKNISQSPQNKPGLPLISNSPKSLFNIPISPTIQGSSQQERGVKSLNLEYFQSGGVVFKPIHTQGQLSERAKTETDAPSQVKITKKGSITSRKDSVKREKWPIKNVNVTNSPPSNYQGPYRSVYKTVSLQSVESKKKRAVLVKQRTQPVINETPSESSDSDGDHDIWGKKDRVLGVRDVSEDWIDGRGSLAQGKAQKEFRTIIKNAKSGEQSPKVIIKKLGSKVTFKTEKV